MSARRADKSASDQPSTSQVTESDYPRRRSHVAGPDPEEGYRTSRRASRAGKKARKAAKSQRRKTNVKNKASETGRRITEALRRTGVALVVTISIIVVFVLLATGINAAARYLAKREAAEESSPEALAEKAKENLLIIGVNDNQGADFLAVRLDETAGQIYGIAIPDGAFMEVPGQGFERIGDSYAAGADVSLAAISNYLSVPFEKYVVVDQETYQVAVSEQTLVGIMDVVVDSSLTDAERSTLSEFMDGVASENVALLPLPVKPISLGDQTFFEPQRDEIAELLLAWWGVKVGAEDSIIRVIVYNGSGEPGIAGEAAQELIKNGMRVVDTKNADRFDYEESLIVVQDGDLSAGESVKDVLGVGTIVDQPSDQDVADIIVIIGADYEPPVDETTTEE